MGQALSDCGISAVAPLRSTRRGTGIWGTSPDVSSCRCAAHCRKPTVRIYAAPRPCLDRPQPAEQSHDRSIVQRRGVDGSPGERARGACGGIAPHRGAPPNSPPSPCVPARLHRFAKSVEKKFAKAGAPQKSPCCTQGPAGSPRLSANTDFPHACAQARACTRARPQPGRGGDPGVWGCQSSPNGKRPYVGICGHCAISSGAS